METPSRLNKHMKQLINDLLSKIEGMGAAPCEDCESGVRCLNEANGKEFVAKYPATFAAMSAVHDAANKLEEAMDAEAHILDRVTVGEHIITATKESTGYLINIQQANAECPTFVAEVLVEVFDGAAGVYIYNELDEAPTQTIRL